ncbi:hypothetical protein [Leptolyngbya sp. BL0902]|uniref:hypothetical protein n=1 Tax=Leptolyngbya sp. BL0902 TaxID=1115757 RepID=UPI0018E6F665|nr:hypothetical protein [Leptolyngbya sp. BL0902]
MAVSMQQRQILTTLIVVIAIKVVKLDECIWQKVQSTMATFASLVGPKSQLRYFRAYPEPM